MIVEGKVENLLLREGGQVLADYQHAAAQAKLGEIAAALKLRADKIAARRAAKRSVEPGISPKMENAC